LKKGSTPFDARRELRSPERSSGMARRGPFLGGPRSRRNPDGRRVSHNPRVLSTPGSAGPRQGCSFARRPGRRPFPRQSGQIKGDRHRASACASGRSHPRLPPKVRMKRPEGTARAVRDVTNFDAGSCDFAIVLTGRKPRNPLRKQKNPRTEVRGFGGSVRPGKGLSCPRGSRTADRWSHREGRGNRRGGGGSGSRATSGAAGLRRRRSSGGRRGHRRCRCRSRRPGAPRTGPVRRARPDRGYTPQVSQVGEPQRPLWCQTRFFFSTHSYV